MEKNKCAGLVYRPEIRTSFPCSYNGKVQRNGKHYCGIHDPVAIAAKDKARLEEWEKEWAESDAESEINKTLSPDTARELIEAADTVIASIDFYHTGVEDAFLKLEAAIKKSREEMG